MSSNIEGAQSDFAARRQLHQAIIPLIDAETG
jgi:hypothetical protein